VQSKAHGQPAWSITQHQNKKNSKNEQKVKQKTVSRKSQKLLESAQSLFGG